MYSKLPYITLTQKRYFWERLLCKTLNVAGPLKKELKECKDYSLMLRQGKYVGYDENTATNSQITTELKFSNNLPSSSAYSPPSINKNISDSTSCETGYATVDQYR